MGVADEPFPGSWAVAAGALTRWELRHDYTRVFPNVYVRKGVELDARGWAIAAGHWAKGDGVLVGRSAAALHGCKWLDPDQPAEINRKSYSHPPPGIVCRHDTIPDRETCSVSGFTVTTPARTAFDIGRRTSGETAIVLLDALCQATGLTPDTVHQLTGEHAGAAGVRQLRAALERVDGGAESPPETRIRLLLIDDGLPRPTTQVQIRDPNGQFVARVDLAWKERRVAVEYDGTHHWTDESQRTWDLERNELLYERGWRVIHVNSEHLRTSPWVICDRVRAALHAAGAPL